MNSWLSATRFSEGVGTDAKNSNVNAMHIGEAGLGLSDRITILRKVRPMQK